MKSKRTRSQTLARAEADIAEAERIVGIVSEILDSLIRVLAAVRAARTLLPPTPKARRR